MLVSLVGGGSFGFGVVSALTPTLLQGLSAGAALSLNVSTMVLGAVLLIGLLCHLIGWMNQLRHVFYATAFVAGAGLVGFALASYVTPAMVQGIIPGLPTTAALGIGFGLMMLGGLAMLLVCRTVVKKITFKHIAKLGLFCVGWHAGFWCGQLLDACVVVGACAYFIGLISFGHQCGGYGCRRFTCFNHGGSCASVIGSAMLRKTG